MHKYEIDWQKPMMNTLPEMLWVNIPQTPSIPLAHKEEDTWKLKLVTKPHTTGYIVTKLQISRPLILQCISVILVIDNIWAWSDVCLVLAVWYK